MSELLKANVRSLSVAPGTERLWPQSHSAKLLLGLDDGGTSAVFLKKVVGANIQKSWRDVRRDLVGNRVEARFYREFAPELARRGVSLPSILHVDEKLDCLEAADLAEDAERESLVMDSGVLYLMEAVDHLDQGSPLNFSQASSSIRALAKLHAATWEDVAFLDKAAARLHPLAGYWTTAQRCPSEFQRMEDVWTGLVDAFRPHLPDLFSRPDIIALASRVKRVTEQVSAEMAVSPTAPFATLVHGDCKAMNLFLPASPQDPATLIDFQWTGVGLGMADVAMHLSHSVAHHALRSGGEERLVELYRQLVIEHIDGEKGRRYTPEIAWRHYHLGVLDWGRMVLSVFFKNATPELFASRADNQNVGLVYRNVEACADFIQRLDKALLYLERSE